jgi:hypothetical protein
MRLSTELPEIFQRICARGERERLFNRDAEQWLASNSDFSVVLEALRQLGPKPEMQLLLLFKSLAQYDALAAATRAETSLVVTDPELAGSGARFTGAVVREMCDAARSEVFVAGFAIAAGSGLENHLARAAARGCRVVVVAGAWRAGEDGAGVNVVLRDWPEHLPKPECYVHERADLGAMHIKALIVDSADMLVGSANFTFSAVRNNFELGIRVRGMAARHARNFLETMTRTRGFRRVE